LKERALFMAKYMLYNKSSKEQVTLYDVEKVAETYKAWMKDSDTTVTITAVTPDYLHSCVNTTVISMMDINNLIKRKKELKGLTA
jgi:galactose-1-phosphate uridylyltransferase